MQYGQIGAAAVLALLLASVPVQAEESRDAGVDAGQQPETDPSGDAGQRPTEDAGVDSSLDAAVDSAEPLEYDGGSEANDAYPDGVSDASVESSFDQPVGDANRSIEVVSDPQSSEDTEPISEISGAIEYSSETTDRDSELEYQATAQIQPTDEVTGFAETVEISEERKAVSDLSEVLSKSVGVQVRSMGGLGSYGAASIRGSTPNQVPVFMDGVQLNMGGFSVVNLGDFSLSTLESVEVYRGNTPLALGTGGIGGAIVLKTKRFSEPVKEYAFSYGSWNTWRHLALYGDEIAGLDSLVIASHQYSDGDFIYYNRNGSLHDPTDYAFVRRTNNQHNATSALLKLSRRFGAWDVLLMEDFFFKDQGLPGTESMYGRSDAELNTFRNGLNLSFKRPVGDFASIDFDLSYLALAENYSELEDIVGLGGHENAHYLTNGVSGVALLRTLWSEQHLTTYRIACRYENYDENRKGLDADQQQSPSHRIRTELGAEHDWSPVERLHIVPTVRGEVHYSHFGGGPSSSLLKDFDATTTTDFFFSPSLGIRYEVVDGLTLRANGGRYNRTPDLAELFGDRGTMVGNRELKPEIGYNLDAGMTYLFTSRTVLNLLRADAAWFSGWTEDLIAFPQNSQRTNSPTNIDRATIQGFELGLRITLFDLTTLSGNYTFLQAIDRSNNLYRGKKIPGRPPHELYGRLDLKKTFIPHWGVGGWFDVDYADTAYVGRYNTETYVTKHLFLGTGIRSELLKIGLTFTIEVKNLLDALVFKNNEGDWLPMSDYDAFPLPGRTFLGTVHWKWL